MQIDGMPAIVTGGASGLGGATAARLASKGAKVTIFDLNEEKGEEHAKAIGGRFAKVDVSSGDDVTAAIAAAEEANGVARILINCAGFAPAVKTVDRENNPHDLELFRKTLEVNLLGSFNVLSKFAARLVPAEPLPGKDGERGVAINTASVAAYEGQMGQAAYSASKGGVVGMMLPIARDLARFGIRVNTIAPGIFLTPLMLGLPQAAQDSLGQQVPFPSRLGDPEEYAHLAESIITNPMLNGESIRLDGAIRMAPR